MDIHKGIGADALPRYGLNGVTELVGKSIQGVLVYERPALVFNPRRMKNSSLGAFTYINGHGSVAIYRCAIGRYCSIGEDSVLGPPEHPVDWLSTHPFAFTQPDHLPAFYAVPEFAGLAPDASHALHRVLPPHTEIGHDVWVGVGAFVKRGLRIGHGAVIAAHAVVTRDVPAYAIVAGSPAKLLRYRFADAIVERLLESRWWHYDLAPHKSAIDFSKIEAALDELERRRDDGRLKPLQPETWRLIRDGSLFNLERLPDSLYSLAP